MYNVYEIERRRNSSRHSTAQHSMLDTFSIIYKGNNILKIRENSLHVTGCIGDEEIKKKNVQNS